MASNSNNPSFGGFIKIPGGDPYIRQSSPGVMPNFFPALTRPDPAIPQALGQLGQDVVKLGAYFKERKDEKARIDLSSRRLALQENIREMEKHARANMNGRAAIFGINDDGIDVETYFDQQLQEARTKYLAGVDEEYLPIYEQSFENTVSPARNFASGWYSSNTAVMNSDQFDAVATAALKAAANINVSEEELNSIKNQIRNEELPALLGGRDPEAAWQELETKINNIRFNARLQDAEQKGGLSAIAALGGGGLVHRISPESIPAGNPDREDIVNFAQKYSEQYGVPLEMILAVMQQESRFNHRNKDGQITASKAGALGIMQLMPGTAQDLGVDPDNLEQNIKGGVQYLAQMHKQFGNWKHALMAYNGGPGAVSDYLRAGNWSGNDKGVRPKENIDYVNSIMGSSAGLTPEQRQKAAATYQEVRLDNYQKHYGDLVTQGNYLSALEDLQKRREAGEISAEDYAKIVMGVNLIDNAITNRENKEYNTRVSAGINEFSTRLNSGRLDPVEFRNNNNIPGGIKNGLLTMCDDTAERNRNKGSREYQAIYMAVDNAIQTGRIKSSLELYNFAGVKENLSWDSFSSLLKNMNTLEGKGTEDYVHLAWKGFKNTGNKEYEILFRSVMSRTLASYGLTVRDPEARELAARLLEYDPKARLYNFQKDPSVSMQALRMGQILANKRQPALDDYENILTYLGKDDTESNHLRLDAAITAMRMSNDSLSLDEAWKLSSPYNDFPGGGKPTLNCGWMVNRYDQDIDEWGNAFGYDPNLIKSAIAVISGGDPYFTAPNGIQGVLPLRLSNQEETRRTKELLIQGRFDPGVFLLPGGPGDVLLRDDPRTNIKAVSQYIGALFASGLTNEQVYRDIFSLMGYGGKELEAKIDQTLTLYRQGGRKWSEKSLIGDNSPQETLEREKTQWQSSPFSGLFPLGER